MLRGPYGVVISSQKGGVGKTTVAANLATALREAGYGTLLVDGDYANPSIGFHMGLEQVNVGFRSVAKGKVSLNNAFVVHSPTGLRILPSEVSGKTSDLGALQLGRLYTKIMHTNNDFVVIDMAPGPLPLGMFSMFKRWHDLEILILTTPEMAAATSAVRLANFYDRLHVRRQFVANKVRRRSFELSIDEIESVCGSKLLAALPADDMVPISIANHIPVYNLYPRSSFSKAIGELSSHFTGGVETGPGRVAASQKGGFWSRLVSYFSGIFGGR